MRQVFAIAPLLAFSVIAFGREEAEYQTWMKTAGATVGSMRNLEAKNGEAAAQEKAADGSWKIKYN